MVLNGSYSKENEDFFCIKSIKEAREMTQQFIALAAFTQKTGYDSQHTYNSSPLSTCKFSLRESDTLF